LLRRDFTALISFVHIGDSAVPSGIVKWFNGQKGYGFIQPDTGGKDAGVFSRWRRWR
jgi:'Cold-shock' DNA-binding domain